MHRRLHSFCASSGHSNSLSSSDQSISQDIQDPTDDGSASSGYSTPDQDQEARWRRIAQLQQGLNRTRARKEEVLEQVARFGVTLSSIESPGKGRRRGSHTRRHSVI